MLSPPRGHNDPPWEALSLSLSLSVVRRTIVGSDRLKADNLQRSGGDTEFGAKSSRQMPQQREDSGSAIAIYLVTIMGMGTGL